MFVGGAEAAEFPYAAYECEKGELVAGTVVESLRGAKAAEEIG